MEGSLRLELSYHSLTGYCVTATLTTHIGAQGENRTHRTTLLRRIRLPIASQGHMMSLRSLRAAHGFLTTKTSFALKRYWFRMPESNCFSYAQDTRVTVTPHSNYLSTFYNLLYYKFNKKSNFNNNNK